MSWKNKEKPLTAIEAITMARMELAHHWFGSKPLVAGVKTESGNFIAAPLDEAFITKDWMLFFIDPYSFDGESAYIVIQEWYKRFNLGNLNFALGFAIPFVAFRSETHAKKLHKTFALDMIHFLDPDGFLHRAFEGPGLPKVVLLSKGKVVGTKGGSHWYESMEVKFQEFVRRADPGLPLRPEFVFPSGYRRDTLSWNLGYMADEEFRPKKMGALFQPAQDNIKIARLPKDVSTMASEEEIVLGGEWAQTEDCIITADSNAFLSFVSPSPIVSILAQTMHRKKNEAMLTIEIDDMPVLEENTAEGIKADEMGRTQAILKDFGFYHLVKALVEGERRIVLRFPRASSESVGIYGIRFGELTS